MSDQSNQPIGDTSNQDDQKTPPVAPTTVAPRVKEQEPFLAEEDKMMSEIKTTSEAIDKEALEKIRVVFEETKHAQPKPVIPPDVEDAGVFHPETEAEKVVADGTTLVLPIDEKTYERGLHERVAGAVSSGVVKGVSSLAVLAMWVGRIIKMAHKHMMKVVFTKEANKE